MKQMLKRDAKLFIRALAAALAMAAAALIISGAAAFAVYRGSAELFSPVRVALVDREDTIISRIAINLVMGQEFVSTLMEIEEEDEDGALEGLRNGTYAAVIILPEDFVGAVMTGEECKGRIILSQPAAASGEVVRSVSRLGSLLLAAGQYGVFAGEELIREYGLAPETHDAFLADSNSRLMKEALAGYDDFFTVEDLPYCGTGMSSPAYSVALWLCFFLCLSGAFFAKMHTADTNAGINTRLRACGIKWHDFIAGKIIFPFAFSGVISLVLLAFMGRSGELGISAVSGLFVLLACAYLAMFSAALFGAMPRCAAAATVIAGAVGLALCGGVIPRAMLPAWVAAIGDCTPLGCALWLVAPAFGGELRASSACCALIYCLLTLVFSRRRFYRPVYREVGI